MHNLSNTCAGQCGHLDALVNDALITAFANKRLELPLDTNISNPSRSLLYG